MVDEQSAEPVFDDPQFRQKRKHGRYRVVDAPQLEGPVADTHAHCSFCPIRRTRSRAARLTRWSSSAPSWMRSKTGPPRSIA